MFRLDPDLEGADDVVLFRARKLASESLWIPELRLELSIVATIVAAARKEEVATVTMLLRWLRAEGRHVGVDADHLKGELARYLAKSVIELDAASARVRVIVQRVLREAFRHQ